jgi:hypothetical protein
VEENQRIFSQQKILWTSFCYDFLFNCFSKISTSCRDIITRYVNTHNFHMKQPSQGTLLLLHIPSLHPLAVFHFHIMRLFKQLPVSEIPGLPHHPITCKTHFYGKMKNANRPLLRLLISSRQESFSFTKNSSSMVFSI